jgi:alpha-tubulin suppressor-like RCC1 family protein
MTWPRSTPGWTATRRAEPGLPNVVEVSAAQNHTCARTSADEFYCWGVNWDGQLGNGTDEQANSPTPVVPSFTPVAISAGNGGTCALDSNGALWCWGYNQYDKFGVDTFTWATTPEKVGDCGANATALVSASGTTVSSSEAT